LSLWRLALPSRNRLVEFASIIAPPIDEVSMSVKTLKIDRGEKARLAGGLLFLKTATFGLLHLFRIISLPKLQISNLFRFLLFNHASTALGLTFLSLRLPPRLSPFGIVEQPYNKRLGYEGSNHTMQNEASARRERVTNGNEVTCEARPSKREAEVFWSRMAPELTSDFALSDCLLLQGAPNR
jgi:hypothetical protein